MAVTPCKVVKFKGRRVNLEVSYRYRSFGQILGCPDTKTHPGSPSTFLWHCRSNSAPAVIWVTTDRSTWSSEIKYRRGSCVFNESYCGCTFTAVGLLGWLSLLFVVSVRWNDYTALYICWLFRITHVARSRWVVLEFLAAVQENSAATETVHVGGPWAINPNRRRSSVENAVCINRRISLLFSCLVIRLGKKPPDVK